MSGPTLTRRQALVAGAAAVVTATLGPVGRAAAISASAPSYLRRSAYTGLAGSAFSVAGEGSPVNGLVLEAVGDLAGAHLDAGLRGHEDAFALTFVGTAAVSGAGAIWSLRHPSLGEFSLFVAPVMRADEGIQRYEAVIDRSTRSRKPPERERPAERPAEQAASTAAEPPAAPASSGASASPAAKRVAAVRRRKRKVRRRRRTTSRHLARRKAATRTRVARRRRLSGAGR